MACRRYGKVTHGFPFNIYHNSNLPFAPTVNYFVPVMLTAVPFVWPSTTGKTHPQARHIGPATYPLMAKNPTGEAHLAGYVTLLGTKIIS